MEGTGIEKSGNGKGGKEKTPRRKRDPIATRGAIIKAALDLIMAKGFASASISEIARRAGVTKSLIHHHFESKKNLFREVIHYHLSQNEERIRDYMQRVPVDGQYIREGMTAYFRFLEDTPDYVRMGWQMNQLFERNEQGLPSLLEPDPQERGKGYFPTLAQTSVARLAELQKAGRLRSDLPPAMILVAVFCLTEHWHEAKRRMLRRFGMDGGDEGLDDRFLDSAIEILLHGILPGPGSEPRDA